MEVSSHYDNPRLFRDTVNRERKPPSSPGSWVLIKNRCASCVFTLPFYYRSLKYTEKQKNCAVNSHILTA